MKKMILLGGLVLFLAGCGSTASKPQVVSPQPEATTTPVVTEQKTYTLEEVAAANNKTKCWSVINGTVYDLTAWISEHPGGEKRILSICGKDGTAAFDGQHGGQSSIMEILNGFKIGTLQQ